MTENFSKLRWGTRIHPWQMHVDVWQNQYNIVKLKKKLKKKTNLEKQSMLMNVDRKARYCQEVLP